MVKALLLPVLVGVLLLAPASQVFSEESRVRASVVTGTAVGYRLADTGEYEVKNLGLLTMGAMHYDVKPWVSLWGSYGASFQAADNVSQVVALGVEYNDVIKLTLFGGCELGHESALYGYYDPWFIGAGLVIQGIEIDLTDILDGETLE